MLSLLIALVAGTALPPKFVAAALPTASSHGPPAGGVHAAQDVDRVQRHAGTLPASHFVRALSSGSAPRNKNPFHGMWMTRDRPPVRSRLSPNAGSSPFPASLAVVDVSSVDAHWAAPAAADGNVWTQLCVVRC